MSHDISIEQYLNEQHKFLAIDVRSPGEFEESSLPDSVNVPLFTNEERAEIGTIYKQIGKDQAKWRAMEIVSQKLPELLGQIKFYTEAGNRPVLYCWRGGMRSQSLAQFATLAGLSVYRLKGGYRAFRQEILKEIPGLLPKQAVVLYGMTGTRKTAILKRLKEQGYPILDLEGYANHKGSLFGAVDGRMPANQKKFDAKLYKELINIKGSPYFIMEGESKRIGHCVQPEELMELKNSGVHVEVQASLTVRVERIYEEYVQPNLDDSEFFERVDKIIGILKKKIKSPAIFNEINNAWEQKDYFTFIELLLVHYYDPMYGFKNDQYIEEHLSINSDNIELAVKQLEKLLDERLKKLV